MEYKTTQEKMIESLQKSLASGAALSRGQRKRMKKKENFLRIALLEQKVKMDNQLVQRKGKNRNRNKKKKK